jgi:hypothetical protein
MFLKSFTLKLILIAHLLVLSSFLFVLPAIAAGGGHLWFYSQDPSTLPGPQPLPDPQAYDPNYVSSSSDPWLMESIVIPSSDWSAPFFTWLGCAQFNSTNTQLVVSINQAAHSVIDSIMINGTTIEPWDTSGTPPAELAPHGVFNSAEFYGYANASLGNIYEPPYTPYVVAINVTIVLKEGATVPSDAKIHFDAFGYTEEGSFMFSPYSHDLNFAVPEPATIALTAGSFLAFALYGLYCTKGPRLFKGKR